MSRLFEENPMLSIVVTSRNDDHGGNTLHRMQVFAKGLAEQCKKFYLDAELIIVEWNPPADRKRLYEVLQWPDDLGPLTVRFIEVPPEVHNSIGNSDKFPLFQMIAKNVGIRRAKGKFVLATNIDILFSDELMRFLAGRQLEESCFYRIDRHDVGCNGIPEDIGITEQLEFCRNNLVRIQGLHGTKTISQIGADHFSYTDKDTTVHVNACGDFTLMAREKWHLFKGYPELPLWSIYVDGLLVHMAYVSGLRQVVLPYPMRIYHIEHDMGWEVIPGTMKQRPSLDHHKEYEPWCRRMKDEKRPITNNDENWGYAGMEFDEHVLSGRRKKPAEFEEVKLHNDDRRVFREWIGKLALVQNRLYYRDQSPESLNALVELVHRYKPTKIVELGTLFGFSLRAWLSAKSDAEIVAIDLSFKSLRESQQFLPVDVSRVKFLEQNILKTDFSRLWSEDDKVIFYVDAHDMPNVPIMEYVLENALPALPQGSVVVVDDLWYSPENLSTDNAAQFFGSTVTNEIDPLQCFDGYYAPYWKGGSFFGFPEVVPLMAWVNRNRIELIFDPMVKLVVFTWPFEKDSDTRWDVTAFTQLTGRVTYNPVERFAIYANQNLSANQQALALCKQGSQLFAAGKRDDAMECFRRAASISSDISGVYYAQAVCFARRGQLEAAANVLQRELDGDSAHPNARGLLKDIQVWLQKHHKLPRSHFLTPKGGIIDATNVVFRGYEISSQRSTPKKQVKPITIFAVPKAFQGHTGIIQRNAITSWTLLEPRPEIILLGDDAGVAEIAAELGLKHEPELKRNEFGAILVNELFEKAQSVAKNDILAYVNSDIVLMSDFMPAVRQVSNRYDEFLMVGRRWDVNISAELDFNADWEEKLKKYVYTQGVLHSPFGIDYFVFTKGLWSVIPPFGLGRTVWDNWLVWQPAETGKAVIDATQAVVAVHQDHEYILFHGRREEEDVNCKLGGLNYECGSTVNTMWKLTPVGPVRRHVAEFLQNINLSTALKCIYAAYRQAPDIVRKQCEHVISCSVTKWRNRLKAAAERELASDQCNDVAELVLSCIEAKWKPVAEELLEEGFKRLQASAPEEALQYFDEAALTYPKLPDLQVLRAMAFLKQGLEKLRSGNPLEALAVFNEAIVLCPELDNLHFAKATACVQLGKLGSAKAACEAELKTQPGHKPTLVLLERIEPALAEYEAMCKAGISR